MGLLSIIRKTRLKERQIRVLMLCVRACYPGLVNGALTLLCSAGSTTPARRRS